MQGHQSSSWNGILAVIFFGPMRQPSRNISITVACLEIMDGSILPSPQKGDLRLSGPPSGQGAAGRTKTRDRRVPADLRADSLATVLPTPPDIWMDRQMDR
ncbi:hypothetical protein PoB_000087900 [Plakobranchus ocellatus]|uniref:Uncharacterized protein n=1 Tax=Plakobranchus ocellatus TaxID=259542 RepID=A0AAV3XWT3_9GAST|nr:hypothetical protein PoB_000087900 [Plakobranchus ocellatus]